MLFPLQHTYTFYLHIKDISQIYLSSDFSSLKTKTTSIILNLKEESNV